VESVLHSFHNSKIRKRKFGSRRCHNSTRRKVRWETSDGTTIVNGRLRWTVSFGSLGERRHSEDRVRAGSGWLWLGTRSLVCIRYYSVKVWNRLMTEIVKNSQYFSVPDFPPHKPIHLKFLEFRVLIDVHHIWIFKSHWLKKTASERPKIVKERSCNSFQYQVENFRHQPTWILTVAYIYTWSGVRLSNTFFFTCTSAYCVELKNNFCSMYFFLSGLGFFSIHSWKPIFEQ